MCASRRRPCDAGHHFGSTAFVTPRSRGALGGRGEPHRAERRHPILPARTVHGIAVRGAHAPVRHRHLRRQPDRRRRRRRCIDPQASATAWCGSSMSRPATSCANSATGANSPHRRSRLPSRPTAAPGSSLPDRTAGENCKAQRSRSGYPTQDSSSLVACLYRTASMRSRSMKPTHNLPSVSKATEGSNSSAPPAAQGRRDRPHRPTTHRGGDRRRCRARIRQ